MIKMINLKRCREEEKRYFDLENIIKIEIIQKKEEGYDTFEIEAYSMVFL